MKPVLVRIQGSPDLPVLVYLPGMHGHWAFAHKLRKELEGKVRLVELAYPAVVTWSVRDYARAVRQALQQADITRGWILAESFGSQIAWELTAEELPFRIDGLILDGGFVKHPWPAGALVLRRMLRYPDGFANLLIKLAAMPLTGDIIRQIPENDRRKFPFDTRSRVAMMARLKLIATHDPRPLAANMSAPVYFLAGFWDFLVPLVPVRGWLKKHCPGLRNCRTLPLADHATIISQPVRTAEAILEWMLRENGGTTDS